MSPVPTRNTRHLKTNNENFFRVYSKKYLSIHFINYLIFDANALPVVSVLILLAELLLNVLIIEHVPYTEIDWKAYMQECEGFLNGTTNYAMLKGDTGPLVYPAGFVYIYSILYYVTSNGRNIHLAQYVFCLIYLLQMFFVLRLYSKSRKVPPYVLIISTFTSYRIHSIYVLRLFNDPIAILFLYIAINLFLDGHWSWGSICYSWGVACKMNILLSAPALLLFYIINLGFNRTIVQLGVCAAVQIVLGLPFILTQPVSYIVGSFNLARIFEHKWTVNYRFLPLEIFQHRYFHVGLLMANFLIVLAFLRPTKLFFTNYVRLRELQQQLQPQLGEENPEQRHTKQPQQRKLKQSKKLKAKMEEELTPEQGTFLKSFECTLQQRTNAGRKQSFMKSNETNKVAVHFDQCSQLMLLPFFLCNFIGVMCARSLHYQFYVWYFHTLPYLTWSTNFNLPLRFLILGLIEFCWNTYPSTNISSSLLHLCHLILLLGVANNIFKTIHQSQQQQQGQTDKSRNAGRLVQVTKKSVNALQQFNFTSSKIKST